MEPSFFDHREPAADHAGEGEHLRPFEGLEVEALAEFLRDWGDVRVLCFFAEADDGEQDKSFPLEISKERDL